MVQNFAVAALFVPHLGHAIHDNRVPLVGHFTGTGTKRIAGLSVLALSGLFGVLEGQYSVLLGSLVVLVTLSTEGHLVDFPIRSFD
jgi:hypothetical protein